jgi:hypothetical protein
MTYITTPYRATHTKTVSQHSTFNIQSLILFLLASDCRGHLIAAQSTRRSVAARPLRRAELRRSVLVGPRARAAARILGHCAARTDPCDCERAERACARARHVGSVEL